MNQKYKIIFMGTPTIATFVLKALLELPVEVVAVVTQPDKKVGRKQVLSPSPVKVLAEQNDLYVLQPYQIKDVKEELDELNPDAIVTCAYGMFLPQSILDIPTIDSINVHASLLPSYRGGAPIHRVIMAGETKTGISLMRMIKKMDAGAVFSQDEIEIMPNDTTSILFDKMSDLAYLMTKRDLIDILDRKLIGIPQDETKVSFAPIITRDDERLDLSKCGIKIYNQLRGLLDEPGGYVLINDLKVKLFDSSFTKIDHNYTVNTIVSFDDGMIIALKCGLLHVYKIQVPGKKKMEAEQIKHGLGKEWIGVKIA